MLCKYCGNELEEGAKFCPACGKPQDQPQAHPIPGIGSQSQPQAQPQPQAQFQPNPGAYQQQNQGPRPIPTNNPYQQYNKNKTNSMAVAGFILAFFVPLVGLILSIMGYQQIQKSGEKGRGLALAGIIISAVWMVLSVIINVACK